jgi:hypothetical protein
LRLIDMSDLLEMFAQTGTIPLPDPEKKDIPAI